MNISLSKWMYHYYCDCWINISLCRFSFNLYLFHNNMYHFVIMNHIIHFHITVILLLTTNHINTSLCYCEHIKHNDVLVIINTYQHCLSCHHIISKCNSRKINRTIFDTQLILLYVTSFITFLSLYNQYIVIVKEIMHHCDSHC